MHILFYKNKKYPSAQVFRKYTCTNGYFIKSYGYNSYFPKNLRSHHPAEDRIHIRRHKIVPALSLNNNRRW